MPAFAIIKIDPREEHARICQPVDWMPPVIVFGGISYGQLEIVGAAREELEIICAMVNSIGARVASENQKADECQTSMLSIRNH